MKNKSMLKKKRNRQYDEITQEFINTGLNLSEIKIDDFMNLRKKELFKFSEILSNKFTTKSGHQLLPKHMRRRQMSHNPFRIPVLSRLNNLTVNIRTKYKKQKRKLKNLKKSILRRAHNKKWLENHLFLAKRFVMKKYLNFYTIPYKRRDKGYKICLKYIKYFSVICEFSFNEYFILNFKDKKNIEKFVSLLKNKHSFDLNYNEKKSNKFYFIDFFYDNKLIGPISFTIIDEYFIIMNNVIISEKIFKFLNYYKEEFCFEINFTNKLNCFLLTGKHPLKNIYKIFKSCEIKNEENYLLNNEDNFIKHFDNSENGYFTIFKLNKPKSNFRMNEFIFKNTLNELLENLNENINLNNNINDKEMFNNFIKNKILKNSIIPNSEFFIKRFSNNKLNDSNDYFMEEITDRTQLMHRKKVELKKLNNKITQSQKLKKKFIKSKEKMPILTQQKKTLENKSITLNISSQKDKKSILNQENEITYIILLKKKIFYYNDNDDNNNKLKYKDIYYILFPKGYSNSLFRRFIYLNTKAIGLKDYYNFLIKYQQIIFPIDYIGTESYNLFIKEKLKKHLIKYYKRPPSKRTNFQKNLNFSPFYPAWNRIFNINKTYFNYENNLENLILIPNIKILNNKEKILKLFDLYGINQQNKNNYNFLLKINFQSIEKITPKFNDLICLPDEEDIKNYLIYKNFKNKLNSKILFNNNNDNIIKNIDEQFINDYFNKDKIDKNFKIIETNKFILDDKNKFSNNKDFNVELLSILEYYNSNFSLNLTNKLLYPDFTLNLNNNKPSKKIIGFVTNGIYNYSNNKKIGKGFIILNEFQTLLNLKQKFNLDFIPLLIRQKTSHIYYMLNINFN